MDKKKNKVEETKNYKYKFSIVIPIYNVEQYLEETVESVIRQTIGFEENIQIILVNDGSPDNSEEICLKYKELYSNNIIYIKQENAGVSAARNNGMQYIEGKYVNFLDSDDKWDIDALERVWNFFEEHYDEVDMVAARLKFFEAKKGYHVLDYKFDKTKVVDIFEDYNYTQIHMAASFIKSEVFNKYKYDTRLKFSEDAVLSAKIIMEKCKYGVVKEAVYHYRKRFVQNSAIQIQKKDEQYYTSTIQYAYLDLIEESIKRFGYVILYVQYQLMYDIQWRLKSPISQNINSNTRDEYIKNIKRILENIEDNIIIEQKNIFSEYKMLALCLKYNKDIRSEIEYRKGKLYFKNIPVYNILNGALFKISTMDLKNGKLKIEGQLNCFLKEEDFKVYLMTDKKEKIYLDFQEIYNNDRESCVGVFTRNKAFTIEIPVENIKSIKFMFEYKKYYTKRLKISYDKFAKLSNSMQNASYCILDKYILAHKDNKIIIKKYRKKRHIRNEYKYIKRLMKLKKWKIICYRIMYYLAKFLYKKEIWIISDRSNIANDNGIHFFKYVNEENNKQIKTFFAISKNSKDYKKAKKYGKVLKLEGVKYKLMFLLSSKIISSQAEEWVINAFENGRDYIKDLYNFKFVFLQHGIIKDDISKWLHKKNKNISLFVTSAQREYESIVNGKYGYNKEEVILTGLPRYDALTNNPKKKIVIMPTWRKGIAKQLIAGTSERAYDENFINTDYYEFYNNLINDDKLINALKKNGYTGVFCIHPSFATQVNDFKGNSVIEIKDTNTFNYQKQFEENSLLITDYSSVAFDFAYLEKKIIYTQFDSDTFFEGQVYDKGYFNYEEDGFGPVCYDYENTINTIIEAINSDCKIEQDYLNRIQKFYAFHDKNNCKRVYKEILKLK